jgi:hypothetical protein
MKSSLNSSNYSLFNVTNYKKNIDENTCIVMDKYFKVLIEYLKYILDTIKIKNTSYSKFILLRGIETIDHVFKLVLYYTNNLDITYFHTQKSVYFYVEFIQQTSTEENSFLQLSSRDATMYVYRKTIFEISNEHRKNINSHINKETKNKWEMISKNTNLLKKIINNIITKNQFQEDPLKYISRYETIGLLLIKNSYNLEDQNNIDYIINKIKIEFSIEEYLEFIEFILSKKTDGLLEIKNKLLGRNSSTNTNLEYDFLIY